MKSGFSLVELSIVLVILGLLTGGILAGQSLIRAAELRSISTEYSRWVTATQSFRDKYFQLPGDMNNATKFWGDDNAACPDAAVANGTPGTCNGNGNGNIEWAGAAGVTAEYAQYWKQLALAGLIEGSYTGLTGLDGADVLPGTNSPRSKLASAGWGLRYLGNYVGLAGWQFAGDYGNFMNIGGPAAHNWSDYPIMKPEEAWNIDTKMDDGVPGRGKVIAGPNMSLCTTSTSVTDYAATYRLTSSANDCSLYFVRAF